MPTATIFLKHDLDGTDEQIAEICNEGVKTICAAIEGLRLSTYNEFACTMAVDGPLDVIAKLEQFLENHDLGIVESQAIERPTFSRDAI